MTFLTGVVVATAGYDGSKSQTAPQIPDSTDEDRLKVNVETCRVNSIDAGSRLSAAPLWPTQAVLSGRGASSAVLRL